MTERADCITVERIDASAITAGSPFEPPPLASFLGVRTGDGYRYLPFYGPDEVTTAGYITPARIIKPPECQYCGGQQSEKGNPHKCACCGGRVE